MSRKHTKIRNLYTPHIFIALYRSTPVRHTPGSYTKLRTTLFLLCTKSYIVWRSFHWKFIKRKSLKLLGTSRSFRLCCI